MKEETTFSDEAMSRYDASCKHIGFDRDCSICNGLILLWEKDVEKVLQHFQTFLDSENVPWINPKSLSDAFMRASIVFSVFNNKQKLSIVLARFVELWQGAEAARETEKMEMFLQTVLTATKTGGNA